MEQMTITLDPLQQQRMERYCALSGVSKDKAMDEMWDMWVRLIYIPQTDYIEIAERRRKAMDAFRRQREKVERGETPELSMEEIIDEIKKIRAERRSEKGTV